MSVLAVPDEPDLLAPSRRRFLSAGRNDGVNNNACISRALDFWSLPRELSLYWSPQRGTRLAERVRAVYWADSKIVPEGYFAIYRLLPDVHRNVAVQLDLVTLAIARGVHNQLLNNGINRPLVVYSGYRTSRTNAAEGGKEDSYHLRAQALDLHIEGVSSASVASFGRYLACSGVGYFRSALQRVGAGAMYCFDQVEIRGIRPMAVHPSEAHEDLLRPAPTLLLSRTTLMCVSQHFSTRCIGMIRERCSQAFTTAKSGAENLQKLGTDRAGSCMHYYLKSGT